MQTKTAPSKITRQQLPALMMRGPKWDTRITKYIWKDTDLKKMLADAAYTANPGPTYEIGGFRVQEIGSLGSIESGELLRVVQVTAPADNERFPDVLGELCEDNTGPLGDKASSDLRERFDRIRFDFEEYSLIGTLPRLAGVKKRRDQIRIINRLSSTVSAGDRELARRLAQMLADNIENLEPSAEL